MHPTCYPTIMRKTSVYLSDADRDRLRRLSGITGRPQSEVIRMALSEFEDAQTRTSGFAIFEHGLRGPGGVASVADVSEAELLEGFGE
jgi:hypothetical protein